MVRKRKLLTISIILILTFLISTNYLLTILTASQNEVKTIHDKIYQQLKELPDLYQNRRPLETDSFDKFLQHLSEASLQEDVHTLWKTANSWVSSNQLTDLNSLIMGDLLLALKNSKIILADLDTRGTQLKLLLTLEGHQNVVFKPKWYHIERIIEGPVYAGKDRYNSEIIAFYLSTILNIPLTPCSVERTISFSNEVMPVATRRLINTSFELNNRTCVFGKCYYCKKQDAICEDENFKVYGSVIFNINASFKSYRSPWQRTYKKNKKAAWETDDKYCKLVRV